MPLSHLPHHPRATFERLMVVGFCLTLIFTPHGVMATDTKPLTPVSVSDLIKTYGATTAVDRLWQQGQYDVIMDHISEGKAEWIALAPELAKGTDAGSSEELNLSLALALPLNTEAVLRIMTTDNTSPLSPHAICSAPFIEDTVPDIPDYIKRSIAAVKDLKDTGLKDQQKACLSELHQAAALPTYNP